jgi:hypothetical protein
VKYANAVFDPMVDAIIPRAIAALATATIIVLFIGGSPYVPQTDVGQHPLTFTL